MKCHQLKNGFTLVEMMIVVALIGVLSAMVSIQYKNYSRRVKVVGAKANLSSLYTAEKMFWGEHSGYTTRFDAMGFALEGRIHFAYGFGADYIPAQYSYMGRASCNLSWCENVPSKCSLEGTWTCTAEAKAAVDFGYWDPTATASDTAFTCYAHVHWNDGSSLKDTFAIDEKKNIKSIPGF